MHVVFCASSFAEHVPQVVVIVLARVLRENEIPSIIDSFKAIKLCSLESSWISVTVGVLKNIFLRWNTQGQLLASSCDFQPVLAWKARARVIGPSVSRGHADILKASGLASFCSSCEGTESLKEISASFWRFLCIHVIRSGQSDTRLLFQLRWAGNPRCAYTNRGADQSDYTTSSSRRPLLTNNMEWGEFELMKLQ